MIGPRGLAAGAIAALAVWTASSALASDRPADVAALSAGGSVHITSADDGDAILTAAHLVPGQSVAGTVTLTNTGDADGDLVLARTGLADTLGAGGARLSAALRLRLDDITGGAPVTVYDGPLTGLASLPVTGGIASGAERSFRFTATLPDGGTPSGPTIGDNALQGASMSVDWRWDATSAPGRGPTPTPTATPAPPTATPTPRPIATPRPTPKPTPRPTPVTTPTTRPGVNPAAAVLTLQIPWQRVLKTHGITLSASCSLQCRLSFTAKVQTAPRTGRPRTVLARKVFRLRGSQRVLAPNAGRAVKLKLTPRAFKKLHALIRARGRAAVLVTARVSSARGAANVRRRIVIVSPGSARRR